MTHLSKEALERHRKAKGKLRGGGIMMDELARNGLLGPQSSGAPPRPYGEFNLEDFPKFPDYGPIRRNRMTPLGPKNAQ